MSAGDTTPDARPQWADLPPLAALDFLDAGTKPRATQPALFATGTDAVGTGSLLDPDDELHLF